MKKCLHYLKYFREFHRELNRPDTTFCCWDIWILYFCWHKHKWLLVRKFAQGGLMRTFQNLKAGTYPNPRTNSWSVLNFYWFSPNWFKRSPYFFRYTLMNIYFRHPGIMYGLCKIHKNIMNNYLLFQSFLAAINLSVWKELATKLSIWL